MDIKAIEGKIIDLLKSKGPLLPIEISKELRINFLFLNPFLSEFARQGKILRSYRKYGDSFIYYLPGQEEKVREMLLKTLKYQEKLVIKKFEREKVLTKDELTPMERFFLSNLHDFILPYKLKVKDKEVDVFIYYKVDEEEARRIIKEKYFKEQVKEEKVTAKTNKKVEKIEKKKGNETIAKEEKVIKEKVEVKERLERTIISKSENVKVGIKEFDDFINQINARVLSIIEKKRNKVVAIIEYGKLKEKKVACYINKKSLSINDVATFYLTIEKMKIPGIILFKGRISNKLKKEIFSFGEFLKIINLS